jgi:hypothetical protein
MNSISRFEGFCLAQTEPQVPLVLRYLSRKRF